MNSQVKGAILVGVALVAASILISARIQSTGVTTTAPKVTTTPTFVVNSPLREHIPVTDSNNDGIPDWQELLNNTEPITLPPATTTFTPPETLTEQFALDFFETYVRNEGFGAFGRDPQEIINKASEELIAQVQDNLYTEHDITSIASDPQAVTKHANTVALLIDNARLPVDTPNELAVIESALATNNTTELARLDPIITSYSGIIEGMKTIPVPQVMVKEHLDLLNAIAAVRNDIVAMQKIFSDPLVALVRLQRYQDDVTGLGFAVVNLFEKAKRLGDGFQPTDPVFNVYEFQ